MKYQVYDVKEKLYSGVISDVLDQHGYRFQSLPNDLMHLMEDTVLFGPAFTSIGTQVYSMPEDPLTAQCKVVDQLQSGQIYVLVTRGEYCCAVFGELFATAVQKRGGEGVLHKEKVLKVKIPAGVESDTRMRIAGEGEPGLHGGQNGDLYVFITVKPHKLYSREGANLYTRVPVSMACAALGGKIEIPSIDGEKIELEIKAGTQSDQQIKIQDEGMTILRSKRRGELFVKFRVETPVNLSARQKELLEEFRAISKDDSCQPESKGFLDRIKDLFKSVA